MVLVSEVEKLYSMAVSFFLCRLVPGNLWTN